MFASYVYFKAWWPSCVCHFLDPLTNGGCWTNTPRSAWRERHLDVTGGHTLAHAPPAESLHKASLVCKLPNGGQFIGTFKKKQLLHIPHNVQVCVSLRVHLEAVLSRSHELRGQKRAQKCCCWASCRLSSQLSITSAVQQPALP